MANDSTKTVIPCKIRKQFEGCWALMDGEQIVSVHPTEGRALLAAIAAYKKDHPVKKGGN